MSFYDDMQGVALNLLTQFGVDTTIDRVKTDLDPTEGTSAATNVQTQTLKAIQLPVSMKDRSALPTLTNVELRKVLAAGAGSTFEPKNGDVVTLESTLWTVASASLLKPDQATPLIFEMIVMRGAKAVA